MATDTGDVCVIGGGVIGLTAAVALAEDGHRVRVLSRDAAGGTTSAVAGGLCWPYRIRPYEQAVRWAVRSFHVLAGLARNPEETGARMVTGTMAQAPATAGRPEGTDDGLASWYDAVPGLRPARPDELPEGCASGWRARTPLVDMPTHLHYLEGRLAAAGGDVERYEVTSLEAAGRAADVVVNCSGLGARDLVPDPDVHPVQGQLVIVANPGIEEWSVTAAPGATETTYALPQPYGLVLGGTAQEHAWSREPDPAVAEAIVARCARHFPELARARILAHRVGLRPARSAVRLVAERLPGGARCVHNYGHGGAGVTVAWGCADEVVHLVREALDAGWGGTGPGRLAAPRCPWRAGVSGPPRERSRAPAPGPARPR
ncbi:putative D-amino acid oxidase [Streptomyces sp. NBRC 110611]|uniref:FAD-dependent oxidoreductase n=1 Tax=Streptomyces sp. NBRC 110611 TaxID=1621259 RepID=UPI000858007F|nr:FAD-dependent oxidoreductase [Streptomyces sp. NBRC 110611]GAU65652.1 putative D-amino acid oxidase [Streptomyces sp. NBRC 110611]